MRNIVAVHIIEVGENLIVIFLNLSLLVACNQTVALITENIEQRTHSIVRSVLHALFGIFYSLCIMIESTLIVAGAVEYIGKIRFCHSSYIVELILYTGIDAV